jgi:hypothetical protein
MRNPSLILIFTVITLAYSTSVFAQAEQPLFDAETQDSFKVATNAIVTLASNDSLAGASYKLKSDIADDPDSEIDLYKFNGEFPLGDSKNKVVPLIQFSPSYLKFNQNFADAGSGAKIESTSLGLGAGVIFKLANNKIELIPRFKTDYNELDVDLYAADIDNELLDSIIPDLQTWTFIPSLEGRFQNRITNRQVLQLVSKVDYVYIDAFTSNNNIANFSSQSWIYKNQMALEIKTEYPLSKKELYLKPSLTRIDLLGVANSGLGLNNFYEIGLDLIDRKTFNNYLKEIGFGFAYIYEREIQGWRFGLLGKFN